MNFLNLHTGKENHQPIHHDQPEGQQQVPEFQPERHRLGRKRPPGFQLQRHPGENNQPQGRDQDHRKRGRQL